MCYLNMGRLGYLCAAHQIQNLLATDSVFWSKWQQILSWRKSLFFETELYFAISVPWPSCVFVWKDDVDSLWPLLFHHQENAIIEVRAPLNLAQDYTLNRPAPLWIIKEMQKKQQKDRGMPVFSWTAFQFGGHNSITFEILLLLSITTVMRC